MKLLFATTNRGKLAELRALVSSLPIEVLSLNDVDQFEVVEDGLTFEENALKKAREYAERLNIMSLADDSGLCVDALDGAPGVRSARYSEDESFKLESFSSEAISKANNDKLLRALAKVPAEKRGAQFHCALCLCPPEGPPTIVLGACAGQIAFEPKGVHGFGYDPLFYIPEYGQTFAELSQDLKNQISHRARAFEALRPYLEQLAAERN